MFSEFSRCFSLKNVPVLAGMIFKEPEEKEEEQQSEGALSIVEQSPVLGLTKESTHWHGKDGG